MAVKVCVLYKGGNKTESISIFTKILLPITSLSSHSHCAYILDQECYTVEPVKVDIV